MEPHADAPPVAGRKCKFCGGLQLEVEGWACTANNGKCHVYEEIEAPPVAVARDPHRLRNEVLDTLTERAKWYRDGCDGLDDVEGYFASGDCARDAASDLESALSEIRVLESVLARLRGEAAVRVEE